MIQLPDWFTVAGGSARVGALDDRRSRPTVALWVRLRASPSAQDDTAGEVWQRKLEFTLDLLDFRRYFFSFKLIKKPSPVGEGGPRQWWMRSSRDRLTLYRHLIRQPAAATFSHWRRLSFVSALLANKYKSAFSNTYLPQSNTYPPKKASGTTPRNPTFPPLRVILSGGRSPESNPSGRPQVGISNRRAHRPTPPTTATVKPRVSYILNPCPKVF